MIPNAQTLVILNVLTPLVVVIIDVTYVILSRWFKLVRGVPGRWFDWLTLLGSILCLSLSVALLVTSPPQLRAEPASQVGPIYLLTDSLSIYFLFLVNVIALFASWNQVVANQLTPRPLFFNILVNLFHFTMLLVPVVDNLVFLWIAVEATTLVSTLLVSVLDKRNSWEAAWKYLLVTSTGIIFGLFGTMFLANAAQVLAPEIGDGGDLNRLLDWSYLMGVYGDGQPRAAQLPDSLVELSFLFILVGYGTKAGFAPMHTWLPDGHGEAPAPISALLSGVLLKSALYAILRFSTLTNTALGSSQFTSSLLLGTGLVSLLLATPFILNERNRFKRVLAYHSLEHMGIIAFGLGIGGPIALFGALLHTLNHALTKALMFLSFGTVAGRFTGPTGNQRTISNVLMLMPALGLILALGGLALVGMPPFNIFLSELIILWGALKPGANPWSPLIITLAVMLFMSSTTLIFFGLVRHLAALLLTRPTPSIEAGAQAMAVVTAAPSKPSRKELVPLVVMTVLVIVSGLMVWEPLAAILDQSVTILNGV